VDGAAARVAGAITGPPAAVDGAGWGPAPLARDSLVGAEFMAGKRILVHTNEVRTQKLNKIKKSMRS
jgi:hypothetical protein